ncbi:MAG TPA: NAD(P)/FAD-dependent oxidoreductase [Nocardioides sp.]
MTTPATTPATPAGDPIEHVDVVVVGAGLSGIGAAYRLQTERPGTTYAVLEARAAMGGTWDLFRYPGVRSDSDMYTLGYSFKPWRDGRSLADGPSILRYIEETAAEFDIEQHVRYSSRVVAADFDTASCRWTVEVEDPTTGARRSLTCGFLYSCAGYYDYDEPHTPDLPGLEDFAGFEPAGIRLESGRVLEADVVVTATGLRLRAFGGIAPSADGVEVALPEQHTWNGAMVTGLPSFAVCIGYTNASWTLRADLTHRLVCKVLAWTERNGYAAAVPTADGDIGSRPLLDLAAGYVQRSIDAFPRQGDKAPWRVRQNYVLDSATTLRSDLGATLTGLRPTSRPSSTPSSAPSSAPSRATDPGLVDA